MPDHKSLEYDRTATTVTVRGFRTLVILLVINTLMLGWFVAGPQASQFAQEQWKHWQARREARKVRQQMVALQQQCLAHTFQKDVVVLEENPEKGKKLLGEGGYKPIPVANSSTMPDWIPPMQLARAPASWRGFATMKNVPGGFANSPDLPVVFLHERTSPAGKRRLVVVHLLWRQKLDAQSIDELDAQSIGEVVVSTERRLLATALELGSLDAPPTRDVYETLNLQLAEGDTARFSAGQEARSLRDGADMTVFAGQADPDDASHFTIAYGLGDAGGMIDGWLHDDGIQLKPREGKPIVWNGKLAWQLPSAPTMSPATNAALRP